MPNKTLYIRDQDVEIWRRAEDLLPQGESLSSLVTEALKRYVATRSADDGDFKRFELKVTAPEGSLEPGGAWRKIAFMGDEIIWTAYDTGFHKVYRTAKGSLLFYLDCGSDGAFYAVYDILNEARLARKADGAEPLWPESLIAEVARILGLEHVEELDI